MKRRVQQFMRHLLLTVEVFKHSVMQLDIDGLSDEQARRGLLERCKECSGCYRAFSKSIQDSHKA